MPAYARQLLTQTCPGLGVKPCSRVADWEVRNTRNEQIGRFCKVCAKEIARRLNKEPDAEPA